MWWWNSAQTRPGWLGRCVGAAPCPAGVVVRSRAPKGPIWKKMRFIANHDFYRFVPPRGWLLGLNWLQIGARPGLDIPKGKLSARGRPWGPQVPRWGPLKTAIIPKITPKVGCNSTSKGARNANPGVFQAPWTPLSDLDQKIVIFRNHPTSPPLG